MIENTPKKIIGRVELVSFPELGVNELYARIDTGAQTSAIWVSKTEVKNNRLGVVFFGKGNPNYTGKMVYFEEFTRSMVASSNGHSELRYKVSTLIVIAGKRIRARLTLANRSNQTYPVLVGRNVLRGKFIVDVKVGSPIRAVEKARSIKLQSKQPKGKL